MKLSLASTAELYAEHRRTGSDRKRQRIAAELQRRHDELNGGSFYWRFWNGIAEWQTFQRFNFSTGLPPQSAFGNRHSPISR